MQHPESLLVPILMLTDYELTILGAVMKETTYARHYKFTQYELNPIWQESVKQKRWFNLKHTILVLIISGAVILGCELAEPEWAVALLLGGFLTTYAVVLARHLMNILIFHYLNRHPGAVRGEITMDHAYVISASSYQYMTLTLPFCLTAILARSVFAAGGTLGLVLLTFVHWRWAQRSRKKSSRGAPDEFWVIDDESPI